MNTFVHIYYINLELIQQTCSVDASKYFFTNRAVNVYSTHIINMLHLQHYQRSSHWVEFTVCCSFYISSVFLLFYFITLCVIRTVYTSYALRY